MKGGLLRMDRIEVASTLKLSGRQFQVSQYYLEENHSKTIDYVYLDI